MASWQHGIPPWRDAPLRLERNWILTKSARTVRRAMNDCYSDMFNMSVSLTKWVRKLKILMGWLQPNTWVFNVRFRLLIWTRTSAVSHDGLPSVVIINMYDRYDIYQLIELFCRFLSSVTRYVGVELDVSGMVEVWPCESCPNDQWNDCYNRSIPQTMSRTHIWHVCV